jgi:hypothetical protein
MRPEECLQSGYTCIRIHSATTVSFSVRYYGRSEEVGPISAAEMSVPETDDMCERSSAALAARSLRRACTPSVTGLACASRSRGRLAAGFSRKAAR